MSPFTTNAQIPTDIGKMLGEGLLKGIQAAGETKVLVSPAISIMDSISRTATLTFSNQTKDTLETRISVGVNPPSGMFSGTKSRGGANTSPLFDETPDSTSPTPTSDSIQADRSLASWITDLPATLRLAPGEKKTVTVKLVIPDDAKPGEYSAYVVTSTTAALKVGNGALPGMKVVGADRAKVDKTKMKSLSREGAADGFTVQAGAKLIYRHRTAE